ncbi:MAG: sulfite exporter TauE/SafE family protein [FCB group bacterium]|nr:sulfite exporter TauE/SafE family protein [FCB group bacterium]
MEWYMYPAVVAAGFLCGFINTLAGSGSLITLPLLIFLGLPANVANGTNRVAIFFQNIVGVSSFHRQKVLDVKGGLILTVPAILGAIIGAGIAVELDAETMRKVIGGLMAVMLVVIVIRPKRWLEGRPGGVGRPGWIQIVAFFFIGMYGGFIQAGVGFFLLAGLVLGAGYDLVRANAVKVLIVLGYTFFALMVFIYNDQVVWTVGLVLAVGNMLGAWVAARMAVAKGAKFVRYLLIVIVTIAAAKLLGVVDLIMRVFV